MPTKKQKKPEFYKQFTRESFFPDSNKVVKFAESANYWIFKTGKKVYKVKKKEEIQTSIPFDQVFCDEIIRQILRYSPGLDPSLMAVECSNGQDFKLVTTPGGNPSECYWVIVMNQLADRYFLNNLIIKNKVKEKTITQIARYISNIHLHSTSSDAKDVGTHDSLNQQLSDLIYQSKKHLGQTITQPMIDMISRPIERFIDDNRKLLGQRIKRGFIKAIHGNFVSRKIHVSSTEVSVLGRTSDPLKDRFGDVAIDLADLSADLLHWDLKSLSYKLIQDYIKATEDAEMEQIIPIYQALKLLRLGLRHSVAHQQNQDNTTPELKDKATGYYEQAIEVARQV